MPRHLDEVERDLPPDESSVTQYDSPSDSTQGSEHSSRSGHTTRSTSLHSGRSRRLPAPVPVHAQGLYRADGMYHALSGDVRPPHGRHSSTEDGVPLRRAPSLHSVRGMYDPELHEAPPPPPPPRGKDNVSGDSLSYGSQPEYVHYVNPPAVSGMTPYSWADSTSATSQELYFRGHRKYFRRSFCGICLSVSIVSVIIAVIGIVAIAAYLGVMTTDDSEALKYEMQYSGKFRVARGDFFHPSLADPNSADFQDMAERYKKMIETLYGYSYLSDAFRRASVERFGNDSLTVFFRVHLDRRKIPTSVLNTEEAVRDVVTQEVMSLEPRAFRTVSIDIDSIEIKREQKDGASNAPFISRGGGSRLQESGGAPTPPAAPQPAVSSKRNEEALSTAAPPTKRPDTTPVESGTERAASAPPVEPARVEPSAQAGAGATPASPSARDGDKSTVPSPTRAPTAKQDTLEHGVEAYESNDVAHATIDVTGSAMKPQSDSITEKTEESAATEPETQMSEETVAETILAGDSDYTEATTGATSTERSAANGRPTNNASTNTASVALTEIPDPTAVDTAPIDLAPADPVPIDPASIGPAPKDATPVDYTPLNRAPGDLVSVDPAPVDPVSEAPEPTYDDEITDEPDDDDDDVTDEPNSDDDTANEPNSDDDVTDEPISDDVATELAPLLAAGVALGVDRIGYVDTAAPSNTQAAPRPPGQPYYTDVQVGTAYFGGLAPAPAAAPAYTPALAPALAQTFAPGSAQNWSPVGTPASASAPAPAPAREPGGQAASWPQWLRPATAGQLGLTDQTNPVPLYDYNPWNPIIPAFAQSPNPVGGAGAGGSLFVDGGGVRRGGDYPPEVTVQPRPDLTRPGQGYQPGGVSSYAVDTSAPDATTRRPYVQVVQQQSSDDTISSVRLTHMPIPLPESVSVQQVLSIMPKDDDDDTDSPTNFASAISFHPPSASASFHTSSAPKFQSAPNLSSPRPSVAQPTTPPVVLHPTAPSTQYRTESSTSEVREESQAGTRQPQRRVIGAAGPPQLLDPAGGVNRLGIAFAARPSTRRPLLKPTATTTQRVLVVNAAPAGDGAVIAPWPALQPAAPYSGVHWPSGPRPGPVQATPPWQQQDSDDEEERDDEEEDDNDSAESVVSPQVAAVLAPQPALSNASVGSMLAGALGGALSGAANGPAQDAGDLAAPSREQLLNLFRLIALRYPALVANMDQQQLRVLLNDEAARRRLLAPFLGKDRSRTPTEPQRTNTKLLELANISINGTRSDRDGRSHAALRREVAGGMPSRLPPTRRPSINRLSSSVLLALANITRVKVAGGLSGAAHPLTAPTGPPGRPQPAPSGSLSDRLHQLVGFPTRAPPRGGNGTAASSRGKLSHKLMRFHGERTGPDGGCTDPSDFACRTLGGCVPAGSRCDRLLDCADGSDEQQCTCADRLRAQSLHSKLCDGVLDCHDSSDEKFCEWCRPDQFICPEAKHCVDQSALCDGKFDCADGADERQCVTIDASASAAAAGQNQYQHSGLLLVRKKGVWGRLCVDQLDGLVRQSKGRWGLAELGRAVCKALTYQDAKEVKPTGPHVPTTTTETTNDPFFKLLFTHNTLLPEPEKASLMFAEDTCPRQTALHVTCEKLQCGLRPRVKQRQARIVGGGNSSPGAWPWQAAMYRDGEYQCGATLITDRWLLSAGHCYLRSTSRFWLARLGAYRRGSSLMSPYERLHQVSHVIMHPEYQDVGYVHDIALLRLSQPVQMSDFVRPACLPSPKTAIQDGALCTVVGWGQLFESGKIFPDTLQEVQVPLISSQECKKRTVFLPLYRITENMFCAGYERGGRDACLGDSGGPLMCQEPAGEWTLTGITSNGYGCARAGRPGVYTKVANYARWIDSMISSPLPPTQRHRCQGHRCRLGRCLSPAEVCDGIVHCSDGSDEDNCHAAAAAASGSDSL